MDAPTVEARALSKTFGVTPVLRGVDLALKPGRGAVVAGGNGSGKSTLIALLAGLIAPSAGDARLLGAESRKLPAELRRKVGVMTHQSMLYRNLTARENLEFYGALYGIADTASAALRALDRVGLSPFSNQRVKSFSRGMEQRLSFARATLAEPAVLLLDEPFAALDRDGGARLAAQIKAALGRGAAVIITAHEPLALESDFAVFELARGRLSPVGEEGWRGRLRSLLSRSSA